jgi:hypothetical protein
MILTILSAANQPLFDAFEAAGARNTPQFGAKKLVHDPGQKPTNFKYHLRSSYEGVKVLVYVLQENSEAEMIRYASVLEFAAQQQVTVIVLTPFTTGPKDPNSAFVQQAGDKLEAAGVRHFFISNAPLDAAHSWELAKETLMLLDSGWQGRMEASTSGRIVSISPAGRKYDASR